MLIFFSWFIFFVFCNFCKCWHYSKGCTEHSFSLFPCSLLTYVPDKCLGQRHMFIFSTWCGKIICMSWNLSENKYRKTGHSDGWWESFLASCGGEGDKEMGMERLNKLPKEDLFYWSAGKWKIVGGEEIIGKLADGLETTRKEAKTTGPRGPSWLIRISNLKSTLECAKHSVHSNMIWSKY